MLIKKGVSAGSIIALALAIGLTPEKTSKFFEEDASLIFSGIIIFVKNL